MERPGQQHVSLSILRAQHLPLGEVSGPPSGYPYQLLHRKKQKLRNPGGGRRMRPEGGVFSFPSCLGVIVLDMGGYCHSTGLPQAKRPRLLGTREIPNSAREQGSGTWAGGVCPRNRDSYGHKLQTLHVPCRPRGRQPESWCLWWGSWTVLSVARTLNEQRSHCDRRFPGGTEQSRFQFCCHTRAWGVQGSVEPKGIKQSVF